MVQVMLIKSKLVEALGEEAKQIDIHSIDGFQAIHLLLTVPYIYAAYAY